MMVKPTMEVKTPWSAYEYFYDSNGQLIKIEVSHQYTSERETLVRDGNRMRMTQEDWNKRYIQNPSNQRRRSVGYGYALLPTADEPVSTMSFRLTPEEKEERDAWIIGVKKEGMKLPEIAYEVGLTKQRVHEIVRTKLRPPPPPITIEGKTFRTPRDAAMFEFEWEYMHPACRKALHRFDMYKMCVHCIGQMNIIESEYDADGWPYSWAMHGQEKYIQAVPEEYH